MSLTTRKEQTHLVANYLSNFELAFIELFVLDGGRWLLLLAHVAVYV